MRTMNNDEIVAQALLTEFTEAQIYHDSVPENGQYPMICYTDLTETPALHADNQLYARRFVTRVTIVTYGNAGINALKTKVERAMTTAGFMWEMTNKTRNDREYYTALDFTRGQKE